MVLTDTEEPAPVYVGQLQHAEGDAADPDHGFRWDGEDALELPPAAAHVLAHGVAEASR